MWFGWAGYLVCDSCMVPADKHLSCRYHPTKTLQSMATYQIGRIVGPWNNLTPPIRGGIYRRAGDEESVSADSSDDRSSGVSTVASRASSTSSFDSPQHLVHSIRARLKSCSSNETIEDEMYEEPFPLFEDTWTSPSILSTKPYTSAESYTTQAIQDEIDGDVRDYPSVDAVTQRNIILKYQALHQRLQDEAFYDCRYSEYGKEFVRYTFLFVAFLVSLNYGWYITSAAILGLFWVSQTYFRVQTASDYQSIKSCSRPMMQGIWVSPTTSSPTH